MLPAAKPAREYSLILTQFRNEINGPLSCKCCVNTILITKLHEVYEKDLNKLNNDNKNITTIFFFAL